MSCGSCGPSPYSLEYQRRRKPENGNGCGCASPANTCDSPSLAIEGSPLYEWEQKYGKLVTTVTFEQDENGRTVQVVEKKPCPLEEKPRTSSCCSLRYKVSR